MESMEDLRHQVMRYGEQIGRLEREVKMWRDRAIKAEAEAAERKCAMDFAERITGERLVHNASNEGPPLAAVPLD